MANDFFAEIDLDVGEKVADGIKKALEKQSFDINIEVSDNSVKAIEDKLSKMNISVDSSSSSNNAPQGSDWGMAKLMETSSKSINDNIEYTTSQIDNMASSMEDSFTGLVDTTSESLQEINENLKEIADSSDKASNSKEREVNQGNIDISNNLISRGVGVIAGATSAGAIREAGNRAINLEIVSERTDVDYDLIGRMASGLMTGRELMSSSEALGSTENILNKVTDLMSGKSAEGAELLGLLGLNINTASKEEVLEAIMNSGQKDFGKDTALANRLFDQIIGINLNAFKDSDTSTNLLGDQPTAIAIRDSTARLNKEFIELTGNLSGLNVVFNEIVTPVMEWANDYYEHSKNVFSEFMPEETFFNKGESEKSIQKLLDVTSRDGSWTNKLRPMSVDNINEDLSNIINFKNQNEGLLSQEHFKQIRNATGGDMIIQEGEFNSQQLGVLYGYISQMLKLLSESNRISTESMNKPPVVKVNLGGSINE